MAATDKDTIYIDIDDEITTIIDKLRNSHAKVVALVLPKRAAVFQSIVNMKLLKRAADSEKKNLVLITTEAGLLPLAGVAGVHVAKTLTSKPEIPAPPQLDDGSEENVDETPDFSDEPEVTAATAGDKPVGQLAGLGAAAAVGAGVATAAANKDDVETVELDDDDEPAESGAPQTKDFTPPPPKKDKKLKVPNFERFRLWLIIGGAVLILLIVGWIVAMNVLPSATILIKTDASDVNANLNITVSTTATTLDTTTNTIPAKQVTQAKTYNQQVTTTGQKNEGTKATGNVTITNCDSSDVTIPAGTGLTSGGNTYITQQTVTVPDSNFTSPGSGSKCKNDGKASVAIQAQSGGASYNLPSGSNFSVTSSPNYHASSLSGQGSASGGTDNNVQVVSQADIDNAKSKINTNDATVKQTLENQLQQANYYPITATFSAGTPTVTTSANVGDAASSVTVTEAVTYTMFGVQENDLKTLVDNSVKSQIDTSKQSILDEGLDDATFTVVSSTATSAQLTMSAVAEVGPELDTNAIKQQVAGMKSGDVQTLLQNNPDVTSVAVKFSPFFVSSVPKKVSKITIVVAKPTAPAKSTSNASNP